MTIYAFHLFLFVANAKNIINTQEIQLSSKSEIAERGVTETGKATRKNYGSQRHAAEAEAVTTLKYNVIGATLEKI